MGKNYREKSIYMSGFTWGAGFALVFSAILIYVGNQLYGTISYSLFALIVIGFILIPISVLWRKRANK